MLTFIDNFELYVGVGATSNAIGLALAELGYAVERSAGLALVALGQGTASLQLTSTAGALPPRVSRSVAVAGGYAAAGFSFRGAQNRVHICDVVNVCSIYWDNAIGRMRFQVGDNSVLGPAPMDLASFYYIEIELNAAAGTLNVWLNNSIQITLPISASIQALTLAFGSTGAHPVTYIAQFDNFYMLDGTTLYNRRRLGPCVVLTQASVDSTPQQWGVVNAISHAVAVDQNMASSGAIHIRSALLGREDAFTAGTVQGVVFGAALTFSARVDAGTRKFYIGMKTPVVEMAYEMTRSTTYQTSQVVFNVSPTNAPWSTSLLTQSKNFVRL